jgi:uracil-DNA glycosylase
MEHLIEEPLLVLERKYLPKDWIDALLPVLTSEWFLLLKEFLETETCMIYPPPELIYNWAVLCPLHSVKVVIIGQDPYHGEGQAMGLAFSVPETERVPPSLYNIYTELERDIDGFVRPSHGNLTQWAEQGVLLLNTSLTVQAHKPTSHSNCGWQGG